MFLILLNFGWMVDLAMSIFEFLIKSMVFWHPWHLWVCIRSVCWKWNLEPIEAIPPSVYNIILISKIFCLENLLISPNWVWVYFTTTIFSTICNTRSARFSIFAFPIILFEITTHLFTIAVLNLENRRNCIPWDFDWREQSK